VWIGYQFAAQKQIQKIRMHPANDIKSPRDFSFRGSNTGAFAGEETTFFTVTGEPQWPESVWKEYEFTNDEDFLYYRVFITAINSGGAEVHLSEIEMMELSSAEWDLLYMPTTASGGEAPGAEAFTDHNDTPNDYIDTIGKVLVSTGSGIDFSAHNINSVGTDYEALELVAEYSANDETLNVTLSGIQGNTDDRWVIECQYQATGTGGSATYLRFNNDTSTNYSMSWLGQISNGASGGAEDPYTYMSVANTVLNGYVASVNNLFLKSGKKRVSASQQWRYEVDEADHNNVLLTGIWDNTADEVESFTLSTTDDITGYVKIYKRTNVSLPIYEPDYIDTNIYVNELVQEWTLISGGIDQTFTWDGDVDDVVIFEVINAEIPGGSNVKLRFNNDSGANYDVGYVTQDGAVPVSNTSPGSTFFYLTNSYDYVETEKTTWYLKNTGQKRVILNNRSAQRSDDTDKWWSSNQGFFWDNTSDKITSFRLWTDNTDLTGTFRLYKRVNLQLPVASGISSDMASMSRAGAQSISSGAVQKVDFDTLEYNMGDIGDINNSKFVIKTAGKYLVTGKCNLDGLSGDLLTYIYVNGSPGAGAAHINNNTPTIVDILDLQKDDYLEYYIYHNHGSDRDTNTGSWEPKMSVVRLAEFTSSEGGGGGTSDVQTFLDLDDTPTSYAGEVGKYLQTTASGVEFVDVVPSGTIMHMTKMSRQASFSLPTGGADTKIPLDTIEFDAGGMANTTSGSVFIQRDGKYYINLKHRYGAIFTDQKESWLYLFVNGTSVALDIWEASGGGGYAPVELNTVLDLNEGDELELHMWQNTGSAQEVVTPEPPTISVVQLVEYASVDQGASLHMAKMTCNSGISMDSGVWYKVPFNGVDLNVGDIADTVNNRVTAKQDGKYLVTSTAERLTLMGDQDIITIAIRKNGVPIQTVGKRVAAATSVESLQITTLVDCVAGDYIDTYVRQEKGSTETAQFATHPARMSVIQMAENTGGGGGDLSDYVPWNFGTGTISGTGDIHCNDIYTSSGTVYIGDLQLSADGNDLLVNDAPVSTASGSSTFLGLTDTPSVYPDVVKQVVITIDHTKIDSTLTNFPLTVVLNSSLVFTELGANSKKFQILTEASQQCYTEIELWEEGSNKAVLHTKVPSISSVEDTVLRLVYSADLPDNTTYVGDVNSTPAEAVWDSDFIAVYNMAQSPAGGSLCIKDSTSNHNHGTPAGGMGGGDLVNGLVGKGIDFDGGDDEINIPYTSSQNLTTQLTLEALHKPDDFSIDGYQKIVVRGGANPAFDYFFQTGAGATGSTDNLLGGTYHPSSTSHSINISNAYVPEDVYYYSALTQNSGAMKGFHNGSHTTNASGETNFEVNTHTIVIGGEYSNSANGFDGVVDNIRISKIARTDAWIKATNFSLRNTLCTYEVTEVPFSGYLGANDAATALEFKLFPSYVESFLDLNDTPVTYSGTENQHLISTGSGIVWEELPESPTTFSGLTDTPDDYGETGQLLVSTGSGIDFVSAAAGGLGTSGARVYRSTTQSLPDGVYTPLSWDTTLRDDEGYWDVSNPTRLTAPSDGWYVFTAGFNTSSAPTSVRTKWQVNGTKILDFNRISGQGSNDARAHACTEYLNAGDYVEFLAYASDGSAVTGVAGPTDLSGNTGAIAKISGSYTEAPPAEGNWVLVATIEADNETFSESIPWDGDNWPRAKIESSWTKMTTVAPDTTFRLNNDSGSNYSVGLITQHGSSADGGSVLSGSDFRYCLGTPLATRQIFATTDVYLKSGGPRFVNCQDTVYDSANTDRITSTFAGYWSNTEDNVTSIDIAVANAVSCTIKVYRWRDITDIPVDKGKQSLQVEYATTSGIYINPGTIHMKDSYYGMYELNDRTEVTVSGLATDTWYYVYTNVSGSTSTLDSSNFTASSGIPTIDYPNMGYYDGDDRCIGVIYSTDSSEVLIFDLFAGEVVWRSAANPNGWQNPSDSETSTTLVVPPGWKCQAAATFLINNSNDNQDLYYRTDSTYGGHHVARQSSANSANVNSKPVLVNDDGTILIYFGSATPDGVYVRTDSFTLPDYIYTGA